MKLRQILQTIYTIVMFAVTAPANAILIDSSTGECDQATCMLGTTDLAGYDWADNAIVVVMLQEVTGANGLPVLSQDRRAGIPPDVLDRLLALFDTTYVDSKLRYVAGATRDRSNGPPYGNNILEVGLTGLLEVALTGLLDSAQDAWIHQTNINPDWQRTGRLAGTFHPDRKERMPR
jgi:hypothetical protein